MTDRRHTGPGIKVRLNQMSWASGVTAAVSQTLENVTMLVEKIVVVTNNSTNAITYGITFLDEDGAAAILGTNFTAIAENAKTVKYATSSTPDFPASMLVRNSVTIEVTPSGDPGASGGTVDIILYGP